MRPDPELGIKPKLIPYFIYQGAYPKPAAITNNFFEVILVLELTSEEVITHLCFHDKVVGLDFMFNCHKQSLWLKLI